MTIANYSNFNFNQANYNDNTVDSETVTPVTPLPDDKISFPLRFDRNSDLAVVNRNTSIIDELRVVSFTNGRGIPLYPLGVGVDDYVFDPNDTPTQVYLAARITDEVSRHIPIVSVSEEGIQFFVEENNLSLSIPFVNHKTSKESVASLSLDLGSVR